MASPLLSHSAVTRFVVTFVVVLLTAAFGRANGISQQVLAEMNLARTNPQGYAQVLANRMSGARSQSGAVREAIRFLERAQPLPPLDFSSGMSLGAKSHVMDIGPKGIRSHYGSGRSTPWSRMNRYGQRLGTAGENIYYGKRDARGIVCALIVDEGVAGRRHRQNIFSRAFHVTGVAYGPHSQYGAMCVMKFASGYMERGSGLAGL